jgi:hypothetical protein
MRNALEEPYLRGDQGRETAGLCEAHLDGCGSISINWTLSKVLFLLGGVPGLARWTERRWVL